MEVVGMAMVRGAGIVAVFVCVYLCGTDRYERIEMCSEEGWIWGRDVKVVL